MIEFEKKFPSVEMLERIAEALCMDTTELFSAQSIPGDSIRKLHKSVLIEFEMVVEKMLSEL